MKDYPEELIAFLISHGEYTERTIIHYREQAKLILKVMDKVTPGKTPEDLGVDDLKGVMEYLRARYTVSTQKNYIIALRRMCEINGNPVFQQYRIRFQSDTRPTVDWLSYEDAKRLLEMWKMPMDEIIVSLELLHGLRRIEVLRLRIQDIHFEESCIDVRGKGHVGGKLRRIPMHPEFQASYERWMKERAEIAHGTSNCRSEDHLLVFERGGKLHKYEEFSGRGVSIRIRELSGRLGTHFSNHTLRRTFGRELYRSGVTVAVISALLGHKSTEQTIRYLGLELDDMTKAMEKFRLKRE